MLPLTDATLPRRWPFVTLGLVAANVVVWLSYQVPAGIDESIEDVGVRACQLAGSCATDTWPLAATLVTSTFSHGSWSHLIGNMVFLVVFGLRVEDELGRLRFAAVYAVAALAATVLEAGLTLAFAGEDLAEIPGIGASGAVSGVLGAYLVLDPLRRILAWLVPIVFLRIPALALVGVWFLLQALEGAYTLSHPGAFVGVAFFAHVGGFLAGVALATAFTPGGWTRQGVRRASREPAGSRSSRLRAPTPGA